ncbi:MAG: TlpA disulfide reductase family protein [Planctomycetota bacterium]
MFPGQVAPDFTATTLDGQELKLSKLQGKVVLIDFWATWCGPCVAELPNVKKAYEQYNEKGLVIIGISFDQDADTARKFIAKKKMNWTHVWAKGGDKSELAKLYYVSGIPRTFLIGPDGKVADQDLRGDKLLKAIGKQIQQLEQGDDPISLITP